MIEASIIQAWESNAKHTEDLARERDKGERRDERRFEELKRVKLVCSDENGTVVSERICLLLFISVGCLVMIVIPWIWE